MRPAEAAPESVWVVYRRCIVGNEAYAVAPVRARRDTVGMGRGPEPLGGGRRSGAVGGTGVRALSAMVAVESPRLMTRRQAADYLGQPVGVVDALIRQGDVPVVRAGRRSLVARAALDMLGRPSATPAPCVPAQGAVGVFPRRLPRAASSASAGRVSVAHP